MTKLTKRSKQALISESFVHEGLHVVCQIRSHALFLDIFDISWMTLMGHEANHNSGLVVISFNISSR